MLLKPKPLKNIRRMMESQLRPFADEFSCLVIRKFLFFSNYIIHWQFWKLFPLNHKELFLNWYIFFLLRTSRLSFYSYVQHKLCHFLKLIFVFCTCQDNTLSPFQILLCLEKGCLHDSLKGYSVDPCCFGGWFLNLGTIDVGPDDALLWGWAAHCRSFSIIPGLYPCNTSRTSQLWQPESSLDIAKCPVGGKLPWLRATVLKYYFLPNKKVLLSHYFYFSVLFISNTNNRSLNTYCMPSRYFIFSNNLI